MSADHKPDESVILLSDIRDDDGADRTFKRVVERIREASHSIVIHMFVWRNDEIGNQIGREVLDAANRGVEIHIKKDTGAFMYERIEMNRKSFFPKEISLSKRLTYAVLAPTFPDTYVEDDFTSDLGREIMEHDSIHIEWVNHMHTKYYIFDDRVMITGSINIEDRHRKYRDYMVEIVGEEAIERFKERDRNQAPYDPGRTLDFVLNDRRAHRFEIKKSIIELLSNARRSAYIEMAYIGDPDVSRKIVEVANGGLSVTMLFSERANIGNDVNYRALHRLYRKAAIDVYISARMIHAKMMMIDEEIVILGSANTSVFSMQKASELDVIVRKDRPFLEAMQKDVSHRLAEGRRIGSIADLSPYNKLKASLQQLHQMLS